MEILIGFVIFFSLVVIIIRRVKAMHKTRQSWIDASYTKPNLYQYSGYWQWPKN